MAGGRSMGGCHRMYSSRYVLVTRLCLKSHSYISVSDLQEAGRIQGSSPSVIQRGGPMCMISLFRQERGYVVYPSFSCPSYVYSIFFVLPPTACIVVLAHTFQLHLSLH